MSLFEGERYYPFQAALEITLSCNMRCIHCGSSASRKGRLESLEFEEWCNVINDLKLLKAEYITLSGGEPFLYPKWKEVIKYINGNNDGYTKISAITNGSLLSDEDVRFLKSEGITHLAVSLDGNEEIHDYIRSYKGAYKKVMELIESCIKHDLRIGVVTSVNKYNFYAREDILEIVLNSGANTWQVQVVNTFGRAGLNRDQLLINHKEYTDLIEDIYRWKKKHASQVRILPADSIGYCHPLTEDLFEDTVWNGCSAGLYNVGIESNGNVKGCLSLQSDAFVAGNVREKNFVDIWFDDDLFWYTRKYDMELMKGTCKECSEAERCKAGCRGMAFSINGSIYENEYCYKCIKDNNLK